MDPPHTEWEKNPAMGVPDFRIPPFLRLSRCNLIEIK